MPKYFDDAGMFDIDQFDPQDYDHRLDAQAARPDIFFRKVGFPRSKKLPSAYWCEDLVEARKLKRSIDYSEFHKAYNAVTFANEHGLLLDIMITFHLERLALAVAGNREPATLAKFDREFKRRLNQWCRDRHLPNLHIGVTENGPNKGLHTHILLWVPGVERWMQTEGRAPAWIRGEQRQWLKSYCERNYGVRLANALMCSGGNRPDEYSQWRKFHYMMKSANPLEIVVQGKNHASGRDLLLGGLIANNHARTGAIPDRLKMSFTSRDLDVGAQKSGAPPIKYSTLEKSPDLSTVFTKPRQRYEHRPFQSKLSAGVYDVRRLYGEAFARSVMKQSFKPLKPAT